MTRAKKRRAWQNEFDVASLIMKGEPGALEWAVDDYVAFRYRSLEVRIVFYPHRTSAGHYHLRIRDEGSKDKRRFLDLAARLYIGSGFGCTFQLKNSAVTGIAGVEPGWAAKEVLGREFI